MVVSSEGTASLSHRSISMRKSLRAFARHAARSRGLRRVAGRRRRQPRISAVPGRALAGQRTTGLV